MSIRQGFSGEPDERGTSGSGVSDVSNAPQISVVIPCHDSAAVIGVQLEALARQVEAPPFEVICVDNRSRDDLETALDPYRRLLDLRLVSADQMANPGYARNVGVAGARADRLAFCDSDDHVSRTWVRDAAAALEVTAIVNGGATPVRDGEFTHGPAHLDAVLDELSPLPGRVEVDVPSSPVPYPILLGGSCAFRADAYRALGGYDVAMPYGVEDNDLALRAQAAGFVIGRSTGMRLAYRSRPESEQTWRRSFRAGRLQALLSARHHLHGRSPSFAPGWWWGLPRTGAAALRMLVKPGDRDWLGLRQRAALNAGLIVGEIRHGVFRDVPTTSVGVGLRPSGR